LLAVDEAAASAGRAAAAGGPRRCKPPPAQCVRTTGAGGKAGRKAGGEGGQPPGASAKEEAEGEGGGAPTPVQETRSPVGGGDRGGRYCQLCGSKQRPPERQPADHPHLSKGHGKKTDATTTTKMSAATSDVKKKPQSPHGDQDRAVSPHQKRTTRILRCAYLPGS